jgi:P-type Ca2+ transporter type 2C
MGSPASSDALTGLGAAEARARLAAEGFNELPAEHRRPLWRVALGVMREPMFFLLVAAAVVYLFIGDLGEALLLLAFATISVAIAIMQQGRSEKALDALRDLTSPRALVVRDGQRVRIPGREVVRGDVVVLAEGDRVPADGVVIAGNHIEVDESLLTGESVPVAKVASPVVPETLAAPGSGERIQVYGGTLVIRGSGLSLVLATGARSAIGMIGGSLAGLSREQPRLERESRALVVAFGIGGISLSIIAMLLYGLLRDSWTNALLGGIALGMALLPEEFPLVLSVFMVMGAWRLSRSRVLTRRAAVIETLGAATVLCTDKTGTLTRNLMSVAHLRGGLESWDAGDPPEKIAESGELTVLLETAALASDDHRVDPMERALAELQEIAGPERRRGVLLREYPLHAELLAVTRVWDFAGEDGIVVAAKGAPEAIAQLCALDPAAHAALREHTEALAQRGVRVLGVARASAVDAVLPATAAGFRFRFVGLVGFADPLRESVPQAVRECRSAGIRVLMITGDYPATARAIAAQAGLADGAAMTGAEVAALDDAALAQRVREVTLFARIAPAQKLRIVDALKANGEIVAMTGDGVNDAPALKAAHIGIAMGGRGTDVAREAASMVLLDDDFGSIVRAVRLGRRIYDNLRKAMGYILAIHVPIAGLALLPVLLGWPLMLTPMLIALLELIIDPACSVVLEAELEESDIMQRPPRRSDSALLSRSLIVWSVLQGACAFCVVALVFWVAANSGMAENTVRTLSFLALVGTNFALIFVNRTFTSSLRAALGRPNRVLWWGLGIAGLVLTLIVSLPAARAFFGLGPVDAASLTLVAMSALLLLGVLELAKRHWRRRLET